MVERHQGEGHFKRQTSCPGHYGHVRLVIERAQDDTPFMLLWQVDEATIPAEFAKAVHAGVLQALTDVHCSQALTVAIIGGSYHPVDSQSGDYREAAQRAMQQALTHLAAHTK